MIGTGYTSTSSMQPTIYYYKKNNITINATPIWSWFYKGELANDIAVNGKKELTELLKKYNGTYQ